MGNLASKIRTLAAETKRRNVYKVAAVYAVTAWGASMGASSLLPAFGAPGWAVRVFVIIAALGLPIAIVLAWAFEVTPQGIVREGQEVFPANATSQARYSRTTMHSDARGRVRISWEDATGRKERSFDRAFRFGRDAACEVHFDDPMVSRHHAEITFQDGCWWIADLDSRNGTQVNGKLVTRMQLPGTSIARLHDAGPQLTIEVHAAPHAATIASPDPRNRS